MTRTTNARVAGVTFLLYIVTGVASMVSSRASAGTEGTAANLANIALHPAITQMNVLAALLSATFALVLGVTLYSLTCDQDSDLATIALFCRAAEGLVSAVSSLRLLALLSIATTAAATAQDATANNAVASLLIKIGDWSTLIAASCFAVGSTLFSYLFLRARSIPVALSWLGVLSSILLVGVLPLQLIGFLRGPAVSLTWLPMLVFEVALALWLIIIGVAVPQTKSANPGES